MGGVGERSERRGGVGERVLPSKASLPPVGLASSRRRRRIASDMYMRLVSYFTVDLNCMDRRPRMNPFSRMPN